MVVSVMLSCIVTNREATYVLVFVEDVERLDGRHVAGRVVRKPILARLLRYALNHSGRSKGLVIKVCCLGVDLSRT